MHVGFLHLDVVKLGRGVHRDVPRLGPFTHNLFVHLAFWWDVHDDVALNGRLTPQPSAFGQAANIIIALFDIVPFGQCGISDCHTVFWEFTIGRRDLAFRTNSTSTADAVEVDAHLARSGQNRRADWKVSTLARRGKNHQRIVAHHTARLLFIPSIRGGGFCERQRAAKSGLAAS